MKKHPIIYSCVTNNHDRIRLSLSDKITSDVEMEPIDERVIAFWVTPIRKVVGTKTKAVGHEIREEERGWHAWNSCKGKDGCGDDTDDMRDLTGFEVEWLLGKVNNEDLPLAGASEEP